MDYPWKAAPCLAWGFAGLCIHISGQGVPWGTQGVVFTAKLPGSICETQNGLMEDGAA